MIKWITSLLFRKKASYLLKDPDWGNCYLYEGTHIINTNTMKLNEIQPVIIKFFKLEVEKL